MKPIDYILKFDKEFYYPIKQRNKTSTIRKNKKPMNIGDYVVAILPSGQVTNHYHIKYWDYFKIPSYLKVKDEFDGHTSSIVLLRYGALLE